MAGGCINIINKKAKIKCDKYDTECQTSKSEDNDLDKTIRS